MTLVQNRLPLLNGNNLLIFLLIISGISSCASKKITTSKNVEVVSLKTKSSSAEPAFSNAGNKNYEDSISKKPVVFDLDNNSNKNNTTNSNTSTSVNNKPVNNDPNRIRNIAVMLPFFLDQISLGQYVDDSTKQLSTDSKNAMDFYLGCQMAREQFESENLKTNVYFLDDKNDSLTTASLFNLKPFPNVDYIIGPLYFKNLKLASDLAKIHQIPLISPLANSMYIRDNSYYFNAFPSLKSQYAFLLEQTKTKFPGKTLEVIYDAQDSTAEDINILKDISGKFYGYAGIKYTAVKTTDDVAKLLYQSDTTSDRIILIYSNKDTYAKSIIAKLKSIKNKLHIFASCIKNTKAVAESKNPHTIYTVYPFNTDNPNYSIFAPKFEEKYKKKTTETVNQGYDLMMHLFSLLDKNLLLQDNTYSYSSNFYNTHAKFQFKPVLNNIGNVDYYDNTFLYLYKYVNGTFIIATP